MLFNDRLIFYPDLPTCKLHEYNVEGFLYLCFIST